MKKTILMAAAGAFLCGCAQLKYVVLRDVPQNPTFTVFPATQADLAFADLVMGAVIANGKKVVERPAVFTEAYGAFITGVGVSGSDGKSVALINDLTTADYMIIAYNGNLLKVIRRKTREVLFSNTISKQAALNGEIGRLLQSLLGQQ